MCSPARQTRAIMPLQKGCRAAKTARRDRPPRSFLLCIDHLGPPFRRGGGDRDFFRRGARLFGLRFRADLRAADRRGLRSADRCRHLRDDRFRHRRHLRDGRMEARRAGAKCLPLAAAAIASAQFGTLILQYADPILLRWMICSLVAVIVGVLASGWRYDGKSASRRDDRGRIIRRHSRRRGADFRPADRDLLARQHARRRDRARQHDLLFRIVLGRVGRDVLSPRIADRHARRARDPARPAACRRDVGRRQGVSSGDAAPIGASLMS